MRSWSVGGSHRSPIEFPQTTNDAQQTGFARGTGACDQYAFVRPQTQIELLNQRF